MSLKVACGTENRIAFITLERTFICNDFNSESVRYSKRTDHKIYSKKKALKNDRKSGVAVNVYYRYAFSYATVGLELCSQMYHIVRIEIPSWAVRNQLKIWQVVGSFFCAFLKLTQMCYGVHLKITFSREIFAAIIARVFLFLIV